MGNPAMSGSCMLGSCMRGRRSEGLNTITTGEGLGDTDSGVEAEGGLNTHGQQTQIDLQSNLKM